MTFDENEVMYADKDTKNGVFKEWIYFLRMLYN